jgi:hypothetical protein
MTMYLHILDSFGATQAVLNTRQQISRLEVADLCYLIQNRNYKHGGYQSEFQGVGVLSTSKDLNKLPRFSNGDIKTEHIPKRLRGESLFDFITKMVKKEVPPLSGLGTLASPWSPTTCPRKASSVTPEQLSQATSLRGQGVTHRKISQITGIPKGSVSKLFPATRRPAARRSATGLNEGANP